MKPIRTETGSVSGQDGGEAQWLYSAYEVTVCPAGLGFADRSKLSSPGLEITVAPFKTFPLGPGERLRSLPLRVGQGQGSGPGTGHNRFRGRYQKANRGNAAVIFTNRKANSTRQHETVRAPG
jgi:hypothetical protein